MTVNRRTKAMKKSIRNAAAAIAVILIVLFIMTSVKKTSKRVPPAPAAELNSSSEAFYGQVVPEGKAVRVSPAVSGTVRSVPVREGEGVHEGQPLCVLDDAVQKAEWSAALARAAVARKAAELSLDQWNRAENLYRGGGITESEVVRLRLKKELDEEEAAVAGREAELARVRLEERTVRAPSAGIVYKMDLRPGEAFQSGDGGRILLGSANLELRCDVEALWIGRIDSSKIYRVFNAETGESLGKATFVSASRYLRPKQVRTEDPQERLSANYQEAVLSFEPECPDLPIGLPVLVRPETK